MTKLRAALVGLTAASLLGLPAAALATTPTTSAHQAAAQHQTNIRWMAFDHIRAANYPFVLVGQVVSSAHGQRGALAGVQVKVYRQLGASHSWVYVGAATTDRGSLPEFRFSTPSRQNALYKVVYAGNASFAPTSKATWLEVYRLFNGRIHDGKSVALYQGNITPFYTHKPVTLQKRACASCPYVDYKSGVTGTNGAFSYALPAPPSGRWWWRVTTPGNSGFIRSYSYTVSTQQV